MAAQGFPCKLDKSGFGAVGAELDDVDEVFSAGLQLGDTLLGWEVFAGMQFSGGEQSVGADARKPSFEDYAALVGSVIVACGLTNPFGPRECATGGDEASRALEGVIAALAGEADRGDTLTTEDILCALRSAETLDLVAPFAKNDLGQRQVVGHKLRKLRGRELIDALGRRFEFGKRDSAPGARYTLHFIEPEGD